MESIYGLETLRPEIVGQVAAGRRLTSGAVEVSDG